MSYAFRGVSDSATCGPLQVGATLLGSRGGGAARGYYVSTARRSPASGRAAKPQRARRTLTKKRRFDRSKRRFLFTRRTQTRSENNCGFRMYTFEPRLLYPDIAQRSSRCRSAPSSLARGCCTRGAWCRLVFVLVAFPPPPVTDPATRLSTLRCERLGTRWADHSRGRHPFLSG